MRYDAIFRDVAGNVLHDYAGYDEKKARHDSLFFSSSCQKAQRRGHLNDLVFLQLMNQYLATMQDRNLQFRLSGGGYQAGTRGFHVRSYEGRLYVTDVWQETGLFPGDQIITLGGVPPALYKKRLPRNILGADLEERELWDPILKMSGPCLVKHRDGTDETQKLNRYPLSKKLPRLGGRLIGRNTLYLDLPHFTDAYALAKLLTSKEKTLKPCTKLILDLRHNIGGSEAFFVPLLDYIMEEPVLLKDLYEEKGLYTNYTENNCRRKIQMFENYLPGAEPPARELAETIIRELHEKSGRGMVWEPDEELAADETTVGGAGQFDRVVILSDTYCEYAGETFIQLCRRSQKTTVLGRPTMGNIDYCNPVSILYGGRFTFQYPMSKTKAAVEGRGVSGQGVPVDLYVPWTPQECEKDVLLEKAIEL